MAISSDNQSFKQQLQLAKQRSSKEFESLLFNRWKKQTHFLRCSKLVQRRTGINIAASSNKNYLALQERVLKLSTPMSKTIKEHLHSIERNKRGLTEKEQILFNRLYKSEWYLVHGTDEKVLESINKRGKKELLSLEELYLKNVSNVFSMTGSIGEILDGVFFSIAPGIPEGHGSFFGDVKISVNLNKIDPASLLGLFVSGCFHTFKARDIHYTSESRFFYGTKCYEKSSEFLTEAGYDIKRQYCFELPNGEIVSEWVDKSSEIFTFSVMRQALTLKIIEKIRQLGLDAWKKIYNNVENLSDKEIHELSKIVFNINYLEAHIPRSLNIEQRGVDISVEKNVVPEDHVGASEADQKLSQETVVTTPAPVSREYTVIFEGADPKTGKRWCLLEDGRDDLKPCMFSIRSNKATLGPLNILIENENQYSSALELARRIAYGYFAIPPFAIQKVHQTKQGPAWGYEVTLHIYLEDPKQNARLMREFPEYIVFLEAMQIEKMLSEIAVYGSSLTQSTHSSPSPNNLVMSYLFTAFKNRKKIQYPDPTESVEAQERAKPASAMAR